MNINYRTITYFQSIAASLTRIIILPFSRGNELRISTKVIGLCNTFYTLYCFCRGMPI